MEGAAARPILYGAEYSVYVRISRLTLAEKGVECELVPVNIFSDDIPDWYLKLQPFGRIPAFAHGDFRLFETAAITRYVDEAFNGPALQPADPQGRAIMSQIIGLLDAYAYRTLVWDIYVERVSKPRQGEIPDGARIKAAMPRARICLDALARLKREGAWLLGDQLTLCDLHAAPMLAYFVEAPEGAAMLRDHPDLVDWWQAISNRAGFPAIIAGN